MRIHPIQEAGKPGNMTLYFQIATTVFASRVANCKQTSTGLPYRTCCRHRGLPLINNIARPCRHLGWPCLPIGLIIADYSTRQIKRIRNSQSVVHGEKK